MAEKSSKATKKAPDKKKGGLRKWFKELRAELKKVVWPSKKTVVNNTGIVISAILFCGAIIWVMDFGLSTLLRFVLGGGNA